MNAPNCDADRFREPLVPDVLLLPLRILVVEDEGLIALNLELILRRCGCDIVGPISEVDQIIDAARTHRPDGAFLDVNLRGRRVFDVLPEMIGLGIPCVLSSGYDDPMLFPAAYRNLPRIAKPFDEDALRRACAEFGTLAEARRAERAAESPLGQNQSGESHPVILPIRRFPVPVRPISQEEDSRAVVGRR